MKAGVWFFVLSAILLSATGCEHKELCYEHPHGTRVDVVFDWSKAPDASPASMSFYLFPQEGGKPLRYEFQGCAGGSINVPAGSYDVLCLNSDTEGIRYHNTGSLTTFELRTDDAAGIPGIGVFGSGSSGQLPRADGAGDERVAMEPDMVWTDRATDVRLDASASADGRQTITLTPEASVFLCTVEIRDAANMSHVRAIGASMSTMAGGLLPGIGPTALTDECVTIPFNVSATAGRSVVTGGFSAFGHCPSEQKKHKLVVYAVLADNSKWYYSYDVTEQFHSSPDPNRVHLVIEKLPIPQPIDGEGGFDPWVDEWQDIDVGIDM